MRALPALLATATAVAVAVPTSARAQQAAGTARAARGVAARADAPRAVLEYRVEASGVPAAFPAQVTVADSAGTLVAAYRVPRTGATAPMLVTVLDTDLVLQGETPAGVLTLRLHAPDQSRPGDAITGRWYLGAGEGALRGRRAR